MKTIRTLIVDDEPLARDGLALLASADPEVTVIGQCGDGASAVAQIRELRPDLVFLDVQMPQLNGFEVLAALAPTERPTVIFVTAFEQHAIRAFEVCAVDYLLKPCTDARFTTALQRGKEDVRRRHLSDLSGRLEQLLEYIRKIEPGGPAEAPLTASAELPSPDPTGRIVVKADGALHFIKMQDVVWIEAQGDFVKVQTATKTQLVRETLQSFERKLDPAKFLRIHRSYVVNLDHVRRVETALYGDYSVFMADGTKLRLSRNYRAKLKTLLRPAVPK